jgi:hypothetical protein
MGASQPKFSPIFYLLKHRVVCNSTGWQEALARIYIQVNKAFNDLVSCILSPMRMRSLTSATSLGQLTSAMVFAFK